MPSVRSPFSRLCDVEIFAVEARHAQLLVRAEGRAVRAIAGEQLFEAELVGGVAVVELERLTPATHYDIRLESPTGSPIGEVDFTTSQDSGEITAKIATISDVHLGLERFGFGSKLSDVSSPPYAFRCARAAIAEAAQWGAELLLVKGDLTDMGQEADWDLAAELLADVDMPILFTPGNHDVVTKSEVDPAEGARRLGLDFSPVQTHDLDGVRVVLADTSRDGRGTGDLAKVTDGLLEAVDCSEPALVAFHHNIQRTPFPWFWPPGISSGNAMPVVRALEEANPRLFLTSGHTHRNRLHWLGRDRTVPYTEVSSTSDYPGVWAGYTTTGSGIHQVVRRIASPDAIDWTERTRRVLLGIWPSWSQGRLRDRTVDLRFG